MSSEPARGVIVGHGEFASGLLSAVQQICGRVDVFAAVSNRDYPAEELERVLREHVANRGVPLAVEAPEERLLADDLAAQRGRGRVVEIAPAGERVLEPAAKEAHRSLLRRT